MSGRQANMRDKLLLDNPFETMFKVGICFYIVALQPILKEMFGMVSGDLFICSECSLKSTVRKMSHLV